MHLISTHQHKKYIPCVNTKHRFVRPFRSMTLFIAVQFFSLLGVLGQAQLSVTYHPERICAFPGDTVSMSCNYTYLNSHYTRQVDWVKWKLRDYQSLRFDPGYRGRINVDCMHGIKRCNLQIRSLTASDTGAFYCSIKTQPGGPTWITQPGVYLQVQGEDRDMIRLILFL